MGEKAALLAALAAVMILIASCSGQCTLVDFANTEAWDDEAANFQRPGVVTPNTCNGDSDGSTVEAVQLFTPRSVPWLYQEVCWKVVAVDGNYPFDVVIYEEDSATGEPRSQPFAVVSVNRTVKLEAETHEYYVWLAANVAFVATSPRVFIGWRSSVPCDMISYTVGTTLKAQSRLFFERRGSLWYRLQADWLHDNYTVMGVQAIGFPYHSVPAGWVCNETAYADGRKCECGCGLWDPDCRASVSGPISANCNTDEVCNRDGICWNPHWSNNVCNISSFGSYDGCQCGCGGDVDPDCRDSDEATPFHPRALNCPGMRVAMCTEANLCSEAWHNVNCSASRFGDGVCDCQCQSIGSVADPDCLLPGTPSDCGVNGHCFEGACRPFPQAWTCHPQFYHDGHYCDCECGVSDSQDCDIQSGLTAMLGCNDAHPSCDMFGHCVARSCGNGVVEYNYEQCELGGAGCVACACTTGWMQQSPHALKDCVPICGDGLVVGDEECDSGALCTHCVCDAGHSSYPSPRRNYCSGCGNSVLEIGEECDGGVGCNNCTCQSGFAAINSTSCRSAQAALGGSTAIVAGAAAGGAVCGLAAVGAVILIVVLRKRKQPAGRGGLRHVKLVDKTGSAVIGNEYFVPVNEIHLGPVLGHGRSGIVQLASWQRKTVAAKTITANGADVMKLDEQTLVQASLKHPNVVQFLCYAKTDKAVIIVTEFMQFGSLADVLADKSRTLPLRMRLAMLREVAMGMAYLHSHDPQFIHGSLSSCNVLVDGNMSVKVSDYAQRQMGKIALSSTVASVIWTAPEVLQGSPCSTMADVYSYAIIVWECMTRDIPYGNVNALSIASRVVSQNLRPEVPVSTPKVVRSLMERCWSAKESDRPEFLSITVDWSAMTARLEAEVRVDDSKNPIVQPPRGLIALVLTDVQGATRLWGWNATIMKQSLLLHHEIIRETYRRCNGFEVRCEGEAFMIAFQSPADAARFCCEAQRCLVAAGWHPELLKQKECAVLQSADGLYPVIRGLRVRMGMHVATLQETVTDSGDIDYVGPAVQQTAKIASFSVGGQIVLSSSARIQLEKASAELASVCTLREIGPVSLRGDQSGDEILHELSIVGLERPSDLDTSLTSISSFPGSSISKSGSGGSSSHSEFEDKLFKKQKTMWAIDPREITIDHSASRVAGRGNFGDVYRGQWRGKTVAVKKPYRQRIDSFTLCDIEKQLGDYALSSELRHPAINVFVRPSLQEQALPHWFATDRCCAQFGASLSRTNITIVTEWMDMGSLTDALQVQKFSFQQAKETLSAVCQGMIRLSDAGIVHRDLKAANVLLNSKGDVRITDYALATLKAANRALISLGSAAWSAPEVLASNVYSEKSDVYSFGILMWEILTRLVPLADLAVLELAPAVLAGTRPQLPIDRGGFSEEYFRLMSCCWSANPDERQSFKSIAATLVTL